MKNIILNTLIALTASAAWAGNETSHDILANPGDFAVISDLSTSEVTLFLSYTGIRFDHCGIKLRGSKISPDALNQLLDIQVGTEPSVGKKVDREIHIGVSNPNNTTYGQFFIINTKSGKSFSETFQGLDSYGKVDLIAEILSCKK